MSRVVDATLRLVDKFTGPMAKAAKAANQHANEIAKVGNKIKKSGRNIENAGKTLTKGITTPVAAMGTGMVKAAMDFEAGMDKVQSISGEVSNKELKGITKQAKEMGLSFEKGTNATETAMNALSAKAEKMGRDTKFSASESADAFSYMAMAGWKTKDMLNGIEGVMYLAGATGTDLATTSDIVTDAITALGKKAKDTDHFVDVMATTANSASTDIVKMGETYKYCASTAGALGYTIDDVSIAVGLMASSGVKASNAGTAMRNWMTRMVKPTKESAQAMKDLGIKATDSSGKVKPLRKVMQETRESFKKLTKEQKIQYATMIAGKTGMEGMLAVVNASDKDFNKFTKAIDKSDGAAKKMYKTANSNLKGSITELKSKVESLAISFGDRMLPYVSKGVDKLKKLADEFSKLSPKQQDMIIKTALTAATVGPCLIAFGKFTKSIGSTVKTVSKLIKTSAKIIKFAKNVKNIGSAFSKMGTLAKKGGGLVKAGLTMLKGPAGIAVLAIAGVIAIGVLLYKNWDKVKAGAKKVVKSIKDFGAGVKGSMKKAKMHIVEFGLNTAKEIRNTKEKFGAIIDFLKGTFTAKWKSAWTGVKNIFKGIVSGFTGIIKTPINGVIGLINRMIGSLNKFHVKIPKGVPKIGGKNFALNISTIPMLARGTNNWKGGPAMVHDRGAEIIDLPRGSRVIPHDKSMQMLRGTKKKTKIVIEKLADKIVINEKEDEDVVVKRLLDKIARELEDIDVA